MLGGYTFPWRPESCTIPRAEKESAWAKGIGVLGFLSQAPILESKIIELEWDFVSAAQYEAMKALSLMDALLVWNPVLGAEGIEGDYEYLFPTTEGIATTTRYYYGSGYSRWGPIERDYFEVGDYVVTQGNENWYFIVRATGSRWVEFDLEWTPQWYEGIEDVRVGTKLLCYDPDFEALVVPPDDPWKAAYIYPSAIYPDRCWFTVTYIDPEFVLRATGEVYADTSSRTDTIDSVGPAVLNAGDQGWFDSTYHETYQGQPYFPWLPGETLDVWDPVTDTWMEAVVDPQNHLMPGQPPGADPSLEQYAIDYNVRILSLTGELFKVAGYELPFRRNVKMKLLIRGIAA